MSFVTENTVSIVRDEKISVKIASKIKLLCSQNVISKYFSKLKKKKSVYEAKNVGKKN